jgi:hypothetical protein
MMVRRVTQAVSGCTASSVSLARCGRPPGPDSESDSEDSSRRASAATGPPVCYRTRMLPKTSTLRVAEQPRSESDSVVEDIHRTAAASVPMPVRRARLGPSLSDSDGAGPWLLRIRRSAAARVPSRDFQILWLVPWASGTLRYYDIIVLL